MGKAYTWGDLTGFFSQYSAGGIVDERAFTNGLRSPHLAAVSAHNIRRFPGVIGGRRIHYFTVLRDPLTHFVSVVRYMNQERVAFGIPATVGESVRDVTAWVLDRPRGLPVIENLQTNHLALFAWCDANGGRLDPSRYALWPRADQLAYERERLVAGALAGQEIAVVSAAVQIDQFHPAPAEALEDVDLGRVDHVFNDAGDHRLQGSLIRSSVLQRMGLL